jgi:hypothetical protein
MKVNIYVSTRGSLPRYGFLSPNKPISLLPRGEQWKYVRSVDTAQFNLPEAIEEEIEWHGFWSFGRPAVLAVCRMSLLRDLDCLNGRADF